MPAVFPRLVLALVLAVLPFLGLIARSVEGEHTFALLIRMSATRGDMLEVFPNTGDGFPQDRATRLPVVASPEPREYRIPLTASRYTSLRLDPGNGPGTYTVEQLTVVDSGGGSAQLSLADLVPAHHLQVVERTPERLVVECPPDGYDPQLIYQPATPLTLTTTLRSTASLLRWYLLYAAAAFALLWVTQLAFGHLAPAASRRADALARRIAAHPGLAVTAAALLATLVAMHPVLLLGRSLVSPNNGGFGMLYNHAPYGPEAEDLRIEDTRGSDMGATMWAFLPYTRVQRDALRQGEMPLWNRYNSLGTPLWGQGQSFLLDPLHWLTLLGADPGPGWDLKFAAHRFVFAWGVGIAALIATGAALPACLAAFSAPFVGMFAFRLNHPASFVLTYAPWIVAGWFLLSRTRSWRERARPLLLMAGASALLLFAAPPKEAVVMLAGIHATGILAVLLTQRRLADAWPIIGAAAAAGVIVVLVTAPQWLVFLDTLMGSQTMYDNPAAHLAKPGFASAMILGTLGATLVPSLHVVALVTVLAAFCAPGLRRRPLILACGAGAALAMALSYGLVPASWLVRIPFVRNIIGIYFTVPPIAVVLLSIVSAAGFQALLGGSRRVAVMTTTAVVAAACLLLPGLPDLRHFDGWLAPLALSLAALLPFTLRRAALTFPRILPLAAGTVLLLVLWLPGGQQIETDVVAMDHVLQQPRPRLSFSAVSPAVEAIHASIDAQAPARTIGVDTWLYPGTQALWELESTGGPDALFMRNTWELEDTPDASVRTNWARYFWYKDLARDDLLLDVLNVGYVLALPDSAATLGPPEAMHGPDRLFAFRRQTAWPRAYFVDRLEHYATPNDLLAIARAAGQPVAGIQTGDAAAAAVLDGCCRGAGAVQPADDYRLTTNTTRFHVSAAGAGIAVLAESYLPHDFIATLNGQPVPYARVNHAFKAVRIPGAGEWTVAFEYRPRLWRLSLALGAAGLALLLVLAAAAWRSSAAAPTAAAVPAGTGATGR